MADERPIEEVIGWWRCGVHWHDRGQPGDPVTDDGRTRAEERDLAAWLDVHTVEWVLTHEQADDDHPDEIWHGPSSTFGVDLLLNDLGKWITTDTYPTIRDALIAAVRKVAGE